MPIHMTETAITAAMRRAADTAERQELVDADESGLRLRVTPKGTCSWVLAIRDSLGQMRRFPLGQYPAMGLKKARTAARTTREEVRKGADPVADARQKRTIGREARAGIGTLTALLDLYASKTGHTLKSWPECRRRIDHVFRSLIGKPLATLKVADIQMIADSHKAQQSAAAAVRYLRPVLKWASAPGRTYVNPDLARISPPVTVRRRERLLSADELTRLLPVLRSSERPYAGAMLFMLLTLARREEVGAARWAQVNLEVATWTIQRTKNGQPHVVPLSRQAIDLLRALKVAEPQPNALVFATQSGRTLGNWDREAKALQKLSGTAGWTRHDLRRTGATMLGEMGELPDIIEAALNHVSIRSSLAATYNRSRYRPQVAAALQRLGDELDRITVSAAAPSGSDVLIGSRGHGDVLHESRGQVG